MLNARYKGPDRGGSHQFDTATPKDWFQLLPLSKKTGKEKEKGDFDCC